MGTLMGFLGIQRVFRGIPSIPRDSEGFRGIPRYSEGFRRDSDGIPWGFRWYSEGIPRVSDGFRAFRGISDIPMDSEGFRGIPKDSVCF